MEQSETLAQGTRFGRYVIVRRLGVGGMGAVYEAVHIDLKKRVALKVLHRAAAGEEAVARFAREGKAASRIRHPHVVDVSDVGTQDGTPYLVMEFLDGEDLARTIKREGPMAVTRLLELMLPVIAAVGAAHDERIVHRDLKPENIYLARQLHGRVSPKVLDFGISKLLDESDLALTKTTALLGTPYYMSPEQAQGAKNLTPASDQFSLAVILYECATGARPFRADTLFGLLQQIGTCTFDPPRALRDDLPDAFEHVLLRAMSRDPLARFSSVYGLGEALLPLADDRTREAWSEVFTSPSHPQPRRDVVSLPPPPLTNEELALTATLSVSEPAPAWSSSQDNLGARISTNTARPTGAPSLGQGDGTGLPPRAGLRALVGLALTLAVGSLLAAGAWNLRRTPTAPPPDAGVRALALAGSGCTLEPVAEPVARHAFVGRTTSLNLARSTVLAWPLVPNATTDDDAAASELGFDGRVLRVVDAEETNKPRQPDERRMSRVTVAAGPNETASLRVDETHRTPGRFEVSCGAFRGVVSHEVRDGGSVHASFLSAGGVYFCRTMSPVSPIVFAVQAKAEGGVLSGRAEILVGTTTDTVLHPTGWTLAIHAHSLAHATDPLRDLLTEEVPEAPEAMATPGGGWVVVWRFHGKLSLGWLDAEFHSRGELQTVHTLGGQPGSPRLAANGGALVLLFADHGETPPRAPDLPAPAPPPYVLQYLPLTPGQAVGEPRRLETGSTDDDSEFAPSVASLPDGWAVAWSEGPLSVREHSTGVQQIWFRRFDGAFSPVGASVLLTEGTTGSDPKVMTLGESVLVALMVGRGDERKITLVRGKCAARWPVPVAPTR